MLPVVFTLTRDDHDPSVVSESAVIDVSSSNAAEPTTRSPATGVVPEVVAVGVPEVDVAPSPEAFLTVAVAPENSCKIAVLAVIEAIKVI